MCCGWNCWLTWSASSGRRTCLCAARAVRGGWGSRHDPLRANSAAGAPGSARCLHQGVLCTVYCVLCTVYCVLCTVYCVLWTVYCVLCTVYCVLCTVYCVLCTVYCVLCTVYCVLCTVFCGLWTVDCGLPHVILLRHSFTHARSPTPAQPVG